MTAEQRRHEIHTLLNAADAPVSATNLAGRFAVSRQVIVGDIALLRASGLDISATPRGYIMSRNSGGLLRTVACFHSLADTSRELYAIVDNGCTALDVVVEHPIYGQLAGQLQLQSRYDVDRFLEKLSAEVPPLSALTGGIHLHHLACPDEAAYRRVLDDLAKIGILLTENA
ncbi:MAG: transcription repressor NadR [Candidatus Heteroscillospira sp.]|jgi:transcriptional regulator of NAD metabolism